MMDRKVHFSDIYIGMVVKDLDEDFGIGVVEKYYDKHNVFVKFKNGGSGLYCLDEDCEDYDPLYYV